MARGAWVVALATLAVPSPAAAQGGGAHPAPGGLPVPGVQTGPTTAAASVLLVHDWFGITDATVESAQRLADLGYLVLAVDLYGGRSARTGPEAQALMRGLVPDEVRRTLRNAIDHLESGERPIAIVGFSMGSGPALEAAYLSERVAALATIYGFGLDGPVGAAGGRPTPWLFITGSDDAPAMASLRAVRPGPADNGPHFEEVVLDGARHGFAQPLYAAGANFDPDATDALWARLERFLSERLGGR